MVLVMDFMVKLLQTENDLMLIVGLLLTLTFLWEAKLGLQIKTISNKSL
jgi:hypothetical protein